MQTQEDVLLPARPRSAPAWIFAALLLSVAAAATGAPERSTAAAQVAFTHGVLAFDSGDFAQAAALFAEAVRWDPRQGTALHWLGVTYLQLGRYDEAVTQLAASLRASRPPAAGRQRVAADLELARGLAAHPPPAGTPPAEVSAPDWGAEVALPIARPPPWEGRLGLEAGRDSNPGFLPDALAGTPPLGIHPARRAADDVAALDLRLAATPWLDRGGWSLGLSLAAAQSLHRDFHDVDLTYAEGVASLVHGSDLRGFVAGPLDTVRVPARPGRLVAMLQAGGSDLLVDGAGFVRTVEGAGALLLTDRAGATRLDLEIRDRRYDHDGLDALRRSGTEVALGASRSLFVGGTDRYLRLGVTAGDRGGGRAFAGSFGEAFAEVSAPLGESWTLFLLAARREDRFAHRESNLGDPFGDERNDRTWRLTAASVSTLSPRLRWTVRAGWAERRSNVTLPVDVQLFDYRRTVVSTGLLWFF